MKIYYWFCYKVVNIQYNERFVCRSARILPKSLAIASTSFLLLKPFLNDVFSWISFLDFLFGFISGDCVAIIAPLSSPQWARCRNDQAFLLFFALILLKLRKSRKKPLFCWHFCFIWRSSRSVITLWLIHLLICFFLEFFDNFLNFWFTNFIFVHFLQFCNFFSHRNSSPCDK